VKPSNDGHDIPTQHPLQRACRPYSLVLAECERRSAWRWTLGAARTSACALMCVELGRAVGPPLRTALECLGNSGRRAIPSEGRRQRCFTDGESEPASTRPNTGPGHRRKLTNEQGQCHCLAAVIISAAFYDLPAILAASHRTPSRRPTRLQPWRGFWDLPSCYRESVGAGTGPLPSRCAALASLR
jgi:hypothetical protein